MGLLMATRPRMERPPPDPAATREDPKAVASVVEAAGVPDPEEGRTIRYRIDRLRRHLGFQPAVSLSNGLAAWAAVRREELARGVAS